MSMINTMKRVYGCLCSQLISYNDEKQIPICIDESKINKNSICTKEYRPVMGCNNVVYSNACMARAAGVLQWDTIRLKKDTF